MTCAWPLSTNDPGMHIRVITPLLPIAHELIEVSPMAIGGAGASTWKASFWKAELWNAPAMPYFFVSVTTTSRCALR